MRVLVSRTDRIGDVVLTLPLCALLTEKLGSEVIALSQDYCRPVFEACPYVAEVVEWNAVEKRGRAQRDLLARCHADVVLHVYPRMAIANAALAARVPLRIGTSHRWYHWATCNELEHFSRKRSNLHEAQLNIRLARRLLGDVAPSIDDLARLTTLEPRVPLPPDVETLLDPSLTMVVLHPGSGGSGREWPLDRWHDLAWSLEGEALQLLISGSQAERLALEPWLATLPPHAVDIMGRLELAELIALLARVDGMVAASTGPLHLAAALGRHTLGLYPPTPPMHAGRWAPLGPRAEHLSATDACDAHQSYLSAPDMRCECMRGISVDDVKARVLSWRRAGERRAVPKSLGAGRPVGDEHRAGDPHER